MCKSINSKLQSIQWPVQHVQAYTTTIHHPSSSVQLLPSNVYGAFNLGLHVGDDEDQVQFNRQSLLEYFPKQTQIQWLEQVHGSHVVSVSNQHNNIVADAVVTREKNLALAIMTADCLPIMLSTIDGHVIGAIHGGWKPLVNGIIENTINEMNVEPATIYAWLGPCIGKHHFEVGEEVYHAFLALDDELNKAFTPKPLITEQQKYLADLHVIAKLQLTQLGISNIYSLPECTYSNSERYYSYRREAVTGRMATVICSI